jgi:hypothetical protein
MQSKARWTFVVVFMMGGSALLARPAKLAKPLHVAGVYELQTEEGGREAVILVEAAADHTYRVWGVSYLPGKGPRSFQSSGVDFRNTLHEGKLSAPANGGKPDGPELRFTHDGLVVRELNPNAAKDDESYVVFSGSYLRTGSVPRWQTAAALKEAAGDYDRSNNQFQNATLKLTVKDGTHLGVVTDVLSLASESDDSPKVDLWEGVATVNGPLFIMTDGDEQTGRRLEMLVLDHQLWIREVQHGSDRADELSFSGRYY